MSVLLGSSSLGLAAAELSVAREKILEHRLVSELAVLMLQRGVELDVLRSDYDANGYDVVLDAQGVIRHLQLKATVDGGARSSVSINTRLASKPSGCVLWMNYHPQTLDVTRRRWFGAEPGLPLPDLGEKFVRHTKANVLGEKAVRPGQRKLGSGAFTDLPDLDALADKLFGPSCSPATALVLAQLRSRWGTSWPKQAKANLRGSGFGESVALAHMIDGSKLNHYLREQLGPEWIESVIMDAREGVLPTDVGVAWTALFKLHRAERFTTSMNPEPAEWRDAFSRHTVELIRSQLLGAT